MSQNEDPSSEDLFDNVELALALSQRYSAAQRAGLATLLLATSMVDGEKTPEFMANFVGERMRDWVGGAEQRCVAERLATLAGMDNSERATVLLNRMQCTIAGESSYQVMLAALSIACWGAAQLKCGPDKLASLAREHMEALSTSPLMDLITRKLGAQQ